MHDALKAIAQAAAERPAFFIAPQQPVSRNDDAALITILTAAAISGWSLALFLLVMQIVSSKW